MGMAASASSTVGLEEFPGRGGAFVASRPIQAGEIPSYYATLPSSFTPIFSSTAPSAFIALALCHPPPLLLLLLRPPLRLSPPSCYADSNSRDTFFAARPAVPLPSPPPTPHGPATPSPPSSSTTTITPPISSPKPPSLSPPSTLPPLSPTSCWPVIATGSDGCGCSG